MSRPSVRVARAARWLAIPAALALSGLLVAQASYSAYSDTTANPTNNWSSGTVKLADDDNNTALFSTSNASNLKPGATGTRCITVTSTGSLASVVKLYGTSPATTNGLSSAINLTITQGTGATNASCNGFTALASGSSLYNGTLAAFGSARTGYSNGLGTWAPAGGTSESRSYQFTYTLDANAADSTQGGTAAIGFTWEAQNS